MRTSLKAALLISSALIATPALAQSVTQAVPPEYYTLDARGVDLVSGYFTFTTTEVSIGQPGAGGLSHTRAQVNIGWRDANQGSIGINGSTYTVTLGLTSEIFTLSGATFTPKSNTGATLTQSGTTLTYTTASGTVARYTTTFCTSATGKACTNKALISEIVAPNGETTNYHYVTRSYIRSTDPVSGDPVLGRLVRLQSITNNRGYQLHYKYKADTTAGSGTLTTRINNWLAIETVTGVNNAVDYCAPTAFSCTFTQTWPSVTYTSLLGGPITSATDQSGRMTQYFVNSSWELTGIRHPGSTSNDVTIATSSPSSQVSSVTDSTGTWNYSFTDSGTTRTAVSTGPNGQSTTVVTNLTVGRPASIKDGLNRTTSYQYDTQGRLKRVTQPEGDYAELTYDARGNVTQTLNVPKAGSGLANITTGAAFPASCANPVTCNLPTSTTDASGAVTDYTYDSAHGGVLTVTAPAPTPGADRPQTRYSYTPQTAYYKNSAGSIVAATSSVTLPTVVSTCAVGTAPSCVGTTDESRTVFTYGAAGVGNNLLPSVVGNRDGAGTLGSNIGLTYTPDGDLASVNGPLSGTGDTTTYRYNDARQLVGVIGPDPDGSGALLHRAQRYTYDPRGAVILVEQGTVTATTDAAWGAFSSLQRVATSYDAFGRPTHQRAQSGVTTHSLVQTSYDASGRPDCVTQRMNPASFASPPASACTLVAAGAFGPDRVMKYGYDFAGQLTSIISGFGSGAPITESATYTANGQPLTLTDGKGNVSTLVYDGFGRLSQLRYPNASGGGSSTTDYEEYTYDAASNVTSYRNRGGEVIGFAYDALNRRRAIGGAVVADQAFTYDNLGRLLSAAYTSSPATALSYTWDALGRQTSESGPLGAVGYQYDLAGRRTRITWPDAFYADYDYDLSGQVTRIRENGATSGTGVVGVYAYDNLGRRTNLTRSNGVTTAYGYDGAGRLASLAHDLPSAADDLAMTFAYNPAGQIISRTLSNTAYAYAPGTGSTAYTNNGRNQVTSAGGSAVAYDARQNITSASGQAYAYDAMNRLTSVTGAAAYVYDPAGRLYEEAAASTQRFLYAGDQVIAALSVGGTIVNRFVPGPGIDERITWRSSSDTRYWPIADERGSVQANLYASGAILEGKLTYDEYGVPASTNTGRFGYTGQMRLTGTALQHYKARAYNPALGRFMQTDPIGYQAGANLYSYVEADPINFSDPLGLQVSNVAPVLVNAKCEDLAFQNPGRVICAVGTSGNQPNFNERIRDYQERTDQPIVEPPGVDIDELICQARDLGQQQAPSIPGFPGTGASGFNTWLARVWPGGSWDFKTQGSPYSLYEGYGNFAYGATGWAYGMSEETLLRGAGTAQLGSWFLRGFRGGYRSSQGSPLGGPPYGDDPQDQASISAGIDYAQDHPCED